MNYIDLFAGAGGLSEGFIREGFEPIAHVEMDEAACYTLRTRVAYYYLLEKNRKAEYISYLKGEITRQELYNLVPSKLLDSVINLSIGANNNEKIFNLIDQNLGKQKVDLIIGGPPCQAYSLVGRSRDKHRMTKDPRNYLFKEYAQYLKKYTPKMFVFENVQGLKSAGNGKYFEQMKQTFDELGYDITDNFFEADKFGVLQKRKRVILIGCRRDLNLSVPDFNSAMIGNNFSVKDIFYDLPKLFAGEGTDKNGRYKKEINEYLKLSGIRNGIDVLTQHICRPHTDQDKEIYKIAVELWDTKKERLHYENLPEILKTHKNTESFFDRFKVVAANLPSSQTIVAHIAKDGHYYIHPDIKQNRSLSVREAARLQSFPDDYYFEGVKEGKGRTAAFKQIGNAVPPLMAALIANKLKKSLDGK